MAPINDLSFPFCAAEALIAGRDPYSASCGVRGRVVPNPMTTILAAVPFTPLGRHWGPIVLWSLMSALLAHGLLAEGRWRLLVLLSSSYYIAFMSLQWAPLLLAVLYLPRLLPLVLVKPHVGLPVLVTHLTWRRAAACAAVLLATLLLDPAWPVRFVSEVTSPERAGSMNEYFVPALSLPAGPLLLLAAVRFRDRDARFLLLMSLVPQRSVYDALPLWWLAGDVRTLVTLNVLSWVMLLGLGVAHSWGQANAAIPPAVVAFLYVPLLVKVLRARPGEVIRTGAA